MKKKTIIAIILIVLVVLPVFAFGGKEKKNTTSSKKNKTESTQVVVESPKAETTTTSAATTGVSTSASTTDTTSTSISTPLYKVTLTEEAQITQEDVNSVMDYYNQYYGVSISQEEAENYLIEQILFNQALYRAVSNDEIPLYDGQFNDYVSYQLQLYASYYGITLTTQEEAEAFLQQFGYTFEDFANTVLQDYAQQYYIQLHSNGRLESISMPTDEEIEEFYNANKSSFVSDEAVMLGHVFFAYGDNKETALTRANTALNHINNGLSFEDAVKTYSEDDATKDNNGEFGVWIEKNDEGAISSFGEGAMEDIFKLKIGEVSKLIEGAQGYHIIKMLDHKDAGVLGLDDLYDLNYSYTLAEVIAEQLYTSKQSAVTAEIIDEIIKTLRSEATIKSLK